MKNVFTLLIICLSSFGHAEEIATYTVPVPAALQSVATFLISSPQISTSEGETRIEYSLPPELVGAKSPTIVLFGTPASYGTANFQLHGDQGNAICQTVAGKTTCDIRFSNLKSDEDEIVKVLRSKTMTASEFSQRLQVSRLFTADPHGVLTY